ncbi:MAG TPA: hypothetical protein ENF73_06745, partial [Proteobacteria bacterium]|nr:hypothetical protein [Pseudomonadota bacterium]
LTATPSGTISIWLEWTDADEWDDGFSLERSTDGENFEQVAELPYHHEEDRRVYYEDTGLRPNTTYYYRVRAFNEYGYSDYSNIASATTLEWGGFSEPVYYEVNKNNLVFVALSDLNADGDFDIVAVAESISGVVSILLNNGDGSFGPQADYDVGVRPTSATAADFDGDTYPDLAVANGYSNSVSVLFNEGDGTFGAAVDYEVDGWAYSISAGDFDNDSDKDLAAVLGDSGGKLAILMNDGDGTFASPVYYDAGSTLPLSLVAGHLSDDNDIDIAVSHYEALVSVLLNKGNGTFHSPVVYELSGGEFGSIALGDFDGDSSLDIVVATGFGVGLLVNDGDGTFAPGGDYDGAGSTEAVATGDFDLDGDVDIVVVGGTGEGYSDPGVVSLLLNDGSGAFERALVQDIPEGRQLRSVAVGDLDGDGDLDVVATSNRDDVVVVLFNLLID